MMATSESKMLLGCSSAFRLMLATSWLAPEPWQDHQNRAIRAALSSGLDWDEYLELVERHSTPALSWETLKRMPEVNLPETVRQTLQKHSAACRMRAMRRQVVENDIDRWASTFLDDLEKICGR